MQPSDSTQPNQLNCPLVLAAGSRMNLDKGPWLGWQVQRGRGGRCTCCETSQSALGSQTPDRGRAARPPSQGVLTTCRPGTGSTPSISRSTDQPSPSPSTDRLSPSPRMGKGLLDSTDSQRVLQQGSVQDLAVCVYGSVWFCLSQCRFR